MKPTLVCTPKRLPLDSVVAAARTATNINPLNHAPLQRLTRVIPDFMVTPERIAVLTTKYWGLQGVRLTAGFLDNPPADLRKRILQHMNAWAKTANVTFVEAKTDPQVRIARVGGPDGGYWSYLGTDILHIAKKKQTMNLEEFTMNTPESEFHRVVRHETGHTLGFPHEHMRKALVDKNGNGLRQSIICRCARRCSRHSKNPLCEVQPQIRNPSCATKSPANSQKTENQSSEGRISTRQISPLRP